MRPTALDATYCCMKCGLWFNTGKNHTHVQAGDFLGNAVALVKGEIRVHAQRSRVAAFMEMSNPNRNKSQLLSALACGRTTLFPSIVSRVTQGREHVALNLVWPCTRPYLTY